MRPHVKKIYPMLIGCIGFFSHVTIYIGALSIQQKSPVQIFGIFAGQMERVRPLPRIRGHVLCNTRNAG